MTRFLLLALGALVIGAVSLALTGVSLALGDPAVMARISGQAAQVTRGLATQITATPTPIIAAPPTSTPVAVTPSPAATATPTPSPSAATATTVSFVRLRAAATTNSAVLGELNGGTVVTLGTYRDAEWQQVSVAGQVGYVYRAYLSY